jgi:hypothetical protein
MKENFPCLILAGERDLMNYVEIEQVDTFQLHFYLCFIFVFLSTMLQTFNSGAKL